MLVISLPLLLCLTSLLSPVVPGLVNVTVDDQLGDRTTGLFPEYLPDDGTWHVGSPTEECPTCKLQPSTFDFSQVHEQTWHDATYSPPRTPATVTVHFNGSAVYVYNILPNTLFNTITFVNISFSIDGEDAGAFTRSPDPSSTILYNQLIYRNLTLNDGPHTLLMTAGGDSKSLFLFDYLLYTTQGNDSTSSSIPISTAQPTPSSTASIPSGSPVHVSPSLLSSPSRPVGATVGGVVGGIVVLLGIAVLAFLLRRRSLRSRPTRVEQGTIRRGEGTSESNGFFFAHHASNSILPSDSEPSMRSLDRDGVGARNSYPLGYEASGPDTYPSLLTDATAGRGLPGSADQWSLERRAELSWRLETLQRTRSVLSSSSPYGGSAAPSGVRSGAIEELEVEIAELRGVLATLSARLADREEQDRGPRESLPAYVE